MFRTPLSTLQNLQSSIIIGQSLGRNVLLVVRELTKDIPWQQKQDMSNNKLWVHLNDISCQLYH